MFFRNTIKFCLFASVFLSIPASLKKITHSFKIFKIHAHAFSDRSLNPSLKNIDPDLLKILSQKFNYLDRGAQSYCFESEDQKYVLKIYRSDHSLLKQKHRSQDPTLFLASLEIADKFLKNETLMICSSLSEKNFEAVEVKLTSPLGSVFSINLDQCIFIIQKKIKPFKTAILEDISKNNPEAFYQKFYSFFHVVLTRLQKGIENLDPEISSNFGFDENNAVEIDLGNFTYFRGNASDAFHAYLDLALKFAENFPEDYGPIINKAYKDVLKGSHDPILRE